MSKNVEREFQREKSQLGSQSMQPVDWKYCWYPASLWAPANLKGFNVHVFLIFTHRLSSPRKH